MPRKILRKSLYQLYHTLPIVVKLELEATVIVVFIICGTFGFHYLEHWRFLDAAYFTTTTLATVGYGDFVPQTDPGKILAMAYQLIGIPMFLYAGSLLLERRVHELTMRKSK